MAVFLSDYLPDTDAYSQQQIVAKGLDMHKEEANRRPFQLVEAADISAMYKPRVAFSHKGTYGHALIIAGSDETMGAALISANACLHAGAGLTTLSIPESGLAAMNTLLPEVMYAKREHFEELSEAHIEKYNAIAVGPGLGAAQHALFRVVLSYKRAIIADADAINILAENKKMLYELSPSSIITPHMKEFDRLFGTHKNWWDRLQTAISKAIELNIVIVLKNQYTFIIDQKGRVAINATGNPAMAQGGMGDALTGIITAFLAQGYEARDAAILGVYFHGKAGDQLAEQKFSVTATELIMQLSRTVKLHP
ncbi:MAG: NAD(P)H-hydrate dehydratase [Pedobacter sp.]|nr:MAG: NAD(P)H-hydrate dehydratase [Pedobacter sp.]